MKRLKAAVFGAGFVGRVHIEAIRRLGNVEVAALADDTDERARQLSEQLSIPKSAGDYRRVLDDPSIDAVHICTPNALHRPDGAWMRSRPASTWSAKSRWRYRPRMRAKWSRRRGRPTGAIASFTISVTTPWCSRCAACARPAIWARSWWCRAHTRRIGCSTTPIGTGAWSARTTALRAAWPISARTGAIWPSMSPGSVSPRFAPISNVPQNAQAP